MRVLGIDPGTIRTGYGVVETDGYRMRCIAAGVIHASEGKPLEERLLLVHDGLARVIQEQAPASVAVEDIYFREHPNAALKLGHARGVALLVAAQAGLAVETYQASVVKRTVVGRGSATKDQVGRLVQAMLGLKDLPPVDATDALAIAITHLSAVRFRAVALGAPKRR